DTYYHDHCQPPHNMGAAKPYRPQIPLSIRKNIFYHQPSTMATIKVTLHYKPNPKNKKDSNR
ncbi:MAG: hypothetical protein ORN57_02225, partial [Alphaproteobacteria bacterium]|nr:hypothetical protein [Alphaproteobacteria bacterium]